MDRCILLCTTGDNARFFSHGVVLALRSIRLTNPGLPVVVFYDRLDARQRRALAGCDLHAVDPTLFRADHRQDLTQATFFRFHLARELGHVRRVLYLDTDLVVLDDLAPLFEVDHPLVAAAKVPTDPALEYTDAEGVARRAGLDGLGPVFNAGVVCFDGPYWRRHDLLAAALRATDVHGWETFRNCDQGILNLLACQLDGWHDVGPEYNFWPTASPAAPVTRNHRGLLAPVIRDRPARIVHWAGRRKPWQGLPLRLRWVWPSLNRFTADVCYHQFVISHTSA